MKEGVLLRCGSENVFAFNSFDVRYRQKDVSKFEVGYINHAIRAP